MMPTFLGEPFYPWGFPLPAKEIVFQFKDTRQSVEEIKLKYYEEKTSEKEVELIKEYVLYYIGAPVFKVEFDNQAQEEFFKTQMPLDDMLDFLLDAGIDPL